MPTKRPITVSFPLGLFGTATMNVPPANTLGRSPRELPVDRDFFDRPPLAPRAEGENDYWHWDDIAG